MSWPLLSSARVVAAMSSCNALPVIIKISPTITAGCITKTFISFFILAAGLTAQGGSSNILVIAVPAELVLAQVVDHVWSVSSSASHALIAKVGSEYPAIAVGGFE